MVRAIRTIVLQHRECLRGRLHPGALHAELLASGTCDRGNGGRTWSPVAAVFRKGAAGLVSGHPEEILGSHHPTLAWNVLSDRVEALVTAWESTAEPPRLADFLPTEPANLRYLALVELIKVDMEYRCQRPEHGRRIEQYLDQFPELTERGEVPCDLIYEEYHLRKQSGQKVAAEEYFERFPRQATELGRLLGLESPHLSTSIVGAALRGNRGRRQHRRFRSADTSRSWGVCHGLPRAAKVDAAHRGSQGLG